MKKHLYRWVVALLLVTACTKEDTDMTPIHGQRFSIGVENYEGESNATRASRTVITQLKPAIYDASGQLVSNQNSEQSSDFESFIVEGLPDGNYTAVFMGVGEVRSAQVPTITIPEQLGGKWMPTTSNDQPVADEYLYAQQPFSITDGQGTTTRVELNRVVGRIEIEPIYGDKQWTEGSLTSVTISMGDHTIYATHLNNDTYSGENSVLNFEIVKTLNFYTLPTIEGKTPSGRIVLKGVMSDGKPYEVLHPFELKVERNKRAILRPRYAPDADQFGTFRVYDRDRNASNSHLFFQDGDSYSAVASRSFRPIEPLVARFEKGKMIASFYAALPVRDVTLLAIRPTDHEYFELAWFESLLPFEDRTVDLSNIPEDKLFLTESGKVISVDKLINNMNFKYRSEDPLMKKLMTITWPGQVKLVKPTNDTLFNKNYDLPLRAVHAREAVTMFTNMAFTFSHPDWKSEMLASEATKPFTNDGRVVSCKDELFPRIWNPDYQGRNYVVIHVMTPTSDQRTYGVAYVGSGDYLTMQQNVYNRHYTDNSDNTGLITPFHEYSHTLGYNHNGNLTYGEFTTITVNLRRSSKFQQEAPYPTCSLLQSTENPTLYKKGPNNSVL